MPSKGPGDPEGRRIALRTAAETEEACRLAECLAKALRRCRLPTEDVDRIATDLRVRAIQLRERASSGRIQSRLTTRVTGHPLLERRSVDCLFLDESGTSAFQGQDHVFALGGVAIHEEALGDYTAGADELKRRLLGRTDVSFHEPMMRRHDGTFWFSGDVGRQRAFDDGLRKLLAETPFVAFGVGIRKARFRSQFVDTRADPYLPTRVYDLAITLMMERYVDYLSYRDERRIGRVHLESIGAREDAEHQAAYTDLLLHGTQFVSEGAFQSWMESGCRFSPKTGSNPAELADLVAREMFEWTRSDCQREPLYWDLLRSKFYCRGDGRYGKFGVKVFPAADLEESIEAHRLACGAEPTD